MSDQQRVRKVDAGLAIVESVPAIRSLTIVSTSGNFAAGTRVLVEHPGVVDIAAPDEDWEHPGDEWAWSIEASGGAPRPPQADAGLPDEKEMVDQAAPPLRTP